MRHAIGTAFARTLVLLLALGAATALPPVARAGMHVSLEPDSVTVQPGDTLTVKLTVFQAESQFNGFDAFVGFDPARFAFVTSPLADQIGPVLTSVCDNFFHQFVAHPSSVEIHLSMLCASTFATGPGEIYRFRLRALPVIGPSTLVWQAGTEFYRAGFFVRPVESIPMTVFVQDNTAVPPSMRSTSMSFEPPSPNPFRGGGALSLKFSLQGASRVGFKILDAQGRLIASHALGDLGAGAHSFAWTGLRLAPGRYLVELKSGNNTQAARPWVVVQ
jgi:hypothetical protein